MNIKIKQDLTKKFSWEGLLLEDYNLKLTYPAEPSRGVSDFNSEG